MERLTTIGERIEQLRTERGLSRAALARAIGRSRSYIYDVENDEGNPSLAWLEGAAQALQVTVIELLEPVYAEVRTEDPWRRVMREMIHLTSALAGAQESLLGGAGDGDEEARRR